MATRRQVAGITILAIGLVVRVVWVTLTLLAKVLLALFVLAVALIAIIVPAGADDRGLAGLRWGDASQYGLPPKSTVEVGPSGGVIRQDGIRTHRIERVGPDTYRVAPVRNPFQDGADAMRRRR